MLVPEWLHPNLESKIKILTNIYKKLDDVIKGSGVNDILSSIKEEFNYLFVGHWLQGEIGQDRKDVGMLIKTFLETFKGKKQRPGLILKTSTSIKTKTQNSEPTKTY